MQHRILRALRAAASLLAVAVYLAPVALPVISDLSHHGYHVAEFAQQQRRAALQLGLVHASETVETQAATTRGGTLGGFQHTHGPEGRLHSHVTFVDGLLVSQEAGGQQLEDATNAGPLLVWQVAPRRVALADPTVSNQALATVPRSPSGQVLSDFATPPPRI